MKLAFSANIVVMFPVDDSTCQNCHLRYSSTSYVAQAGGGAVEYTHCLSAEDCPPRRSVLYMTLNNLMELWGMQGTPSLPLFQGLLWPGLVAPNRVQSMSQIELNCVLMLNWIAWNRTVLTFKQCHYAKLNCLEWNWFCMLNWIVWNRTVFDIDTVLRLNWIIWNRTTLTFNYV